MLNKEKAAEIYSVKKDTHSMVTVTKNLQHVQQCYILFTDTCICSKSIKT